ncbi:hypothetical protein G6F46_000404 [Rhizopus delemar]|uniref:MULE transposase domain-containing protein n=2 Tax=Rhizopus TaxID=4842 RepID=A0A9P6ZDS9_9FUNG|nr:hypothetical protein G6F55_000850 [Rhizopus delemar]KAG1553230.1 hypothetical protein G6F51_000721 [Rhizopus arrhizus]KAG1505730.1 hypothetical protein G6F54_000098 [Rhizopus delemar]KAG1517491.1 hypothetical protein G6F53_001332 [Rhizopus delemar]KAG1528589.1 hypothetical protein G6F52_000510 [Rhizopus delemar]
MSSNNNNNTAYTLAIIHEALTPSSLGGVMQLATGIIIKVDSAAWKECLTEINEACAYGWRIFDSNRQKGDVTAEEAKARNISLCFSQQHCCHRVGTYKIVAKNRPVQKKSKKVDCKCTLHVRGYYAYPQYYEFVIEKYHINHVPDDFLDDILAFRLPRLFARNSATISKFFQGSSLIKNCIIFTKIIWGLSGFGWIRSFRRSIGRGWPVAYMITNDRSTGPIVEWLQQLRNSGFLIGPEQFTIDCCPSEVNAITRIFNPTRTKIQFYVFHVTQAWNRHLASVSVPGNTPGENQIFVFLQMITAFQLDYGDQSKFMDYFTRNWYTKDKMKVWSRSFKGRQYSHMLTNNYIESWHNQLKTMFLGRVRNKRLDKLVFVLVNDVEYYLNQEFERVVQGNGTMSPFFKQQRLRELEAEEVDEEARSDMMTGPITLENSGNCRYMVCSFVEGASVGYSIEVTEDNLIMSCTCYDFEKRHQPSATAFWSKEEASYSQVKQIYDQTRAQAESESALLQGIEGNELEIKEEAANKKKRKFVLDISEIQSQVNLKSKKLDVKLTVEDKL